MIYHPFRHLGLKAISIALAVLIWLSVSGEQIVERSLLVPLEFLNVPDRLELVGTPPAVVDVRVRGGSSLLSHLSGGDVVAVLDLSLARPGRRFVPLTTDRVHGPVGVEVTQVSPSSISLEFEPRVTRLVPVVPTIEGKPGAGFTVASWTCQPASATVVGPQSVVHDLTRVVTDPIEIAGATGPVRESVALGVAVPSVRLQSPGKATVTVDIRPVPIERTIAGVAVRARNLRSGLSARLTPATTTVTVKGAPAAVDELTPERFDAFVDLAGRAAGRYNLSIQVEPPPNVEVVQVVPPGVAVRVK